MRVRFSVMVFCVGLIMFSAIAAAAFAQKATGKSTSGDIVRQFPAPEKCSTGLGIIGDSLWLADRTSDKLYRIDMILSKTRHFIIPEDVGNIGDMPEDIKKLYLSNHGWVPLDPSSGRGIFKTPSDAVTAIGNRGNRYLITTVGGGGSKFLRWNYNSKAVWKTKGPCDVVSNRCGEWTPMEEKKD